MEGTFEKEITFLSKVFDATDNSWKQESVTKVARFKEYNQSDKSQHELHFTLIALMESIKVDEDDQTVELDPIKTMRLTVKVIKNLMIVNETCSDQDKTEFLNDSGALYRFGMWHFKEHSLPFFQKLMKK